MNKSGAKILVYDIEVSPLVTYTWGAYESNALEITQDYTILCFAYKWLGDKKAQIVSQDNCKGYKPGVLNDLEVVKKLRELFDEADVLVAHNGDQYDQKMSQSRMMFHKLQPPSPYKQIDTKKVAKKYGRFASNKLDDLGKLFGIGKKLENEGWPLWKGVMEGNRKCWKKMKDYNIQDVVLEEKLYLQLRPWIENHPNVGLLEDRPDVCPKCGGDHMRTSGFNITKTGKRRKYQCLDCGGWCQGRLLIKSDVQYI